LSGAGVRARVMVIVGGSKEDGECNVEIFRWWRR
jgi:hypothetical protein